MYLCIHLLIMCIYLLIHIYIYNIYVTFIKKATRKISSKISTVITSGRKKGDCTREGQC